MKQINRFQGLLDAYKSRLVGGLCQPVHPGKSVIFSNAQLYSCCCSQKSANNHVSLYTLVLHDDKYTWNYFILSMSEQEVTFVDRTGWYIYYVVFTNIFLKMSAQKDALVGCSQSYWHNKYATSHKGVCYYYCCYGKWLQNKAAG